MDEWGRLTGFGDRFEQRRVLGGGTHLSVVLAWDKQLQRTVVLKRHPRTERTAERVRQLLGVSPHPNLGLVRHDFGDGQEHVLVMDYVDGRSLRSLLDSGAPIPVETTLHCAADVAAALDHLHAQIPPFIHGDVKPENIIVVASEAGPRAVLVDVGLAARAGKSAGREFDELTAIIAGLLAMAGVSIAGVPALRPLVRRGRRFRAQRHAVAAAVGAAALLVASIVGLGVLQPRQVPVAAAPAQHLASPNTSSITALTPARDAEAAVSIPVSVVDPAAGPAAALAVTPPSRSRLGVFEHRVAMWTAEYPASEDVYRLDRSPVPELQNRTYGVVPHFTHVATLDDNWLFFYSNIGDGASGTAPIEPDGHMGNGDWKPRPGIGFTHVVGDGHGLIWLYRTDTGASMTMRFLNGWEGVPHAIPGGLGAGFDRMTSLGPDRVLLYASKTGRAIAVAVDHVGDVTRVDNVQLPADLAVLVRTGQGFLVGVRQDGVASVFDLAAPNVTKLASFALGGSHWSAGVGFDQGVVVYERFGAAARVAHLDARGRLQSVQSWKVPLAPVITTID
jgi:hypothetical protein